MTLYWGSLLLKRLAGNRIAASCDEALSVLHIMAGAWDRLWGQRDAGYTGWLDAVLLKQHLVSGQGGNDFLDIYQRCSLHG